MYNHPSAECFPASALAAPDAGMKEPSALSPLAAAPALCAVCSGGGCLGGGGGATRSAAITDLLSSAVLRAETGERALPPDVTIAGAALAAAAGAGSSALEMTVRTGAEEMTRGARGPAVLGAASDFSALISASKAANSSSIAATGWQCKRGDSGPRNPMYCDLKDPEHNARAAAEKDRVASLVEWPFTGVGGELLFASLRRLVRAACQWASGRDRPPPALRPLPPPPSARKLRRPPRCVRATW